MAVIAVRTFMGEIPRTPAHLLPDGAAQVSEFCDFSQGKLRPLKGGLLYKQVGVGGWTAGGAAVNSMFTLEGVGWYTTSVSGIEYFRSPVIDESFDRVYHCNGGQLKVSQWDITQFQGGPPASTVLAGVPAPTVAPTLTLVDLTSLPDYPSAVFSFRYWYEDNAVRYQENTVAATEITPLREWSFVPTPRNTEENGGDTPEQATLVVEVKLDEGTKQLFRVNTAFGATTAARTQALPGGVEVSLTNTGGGEYHINLSWGVVETRAYLYTMKNTFNEESAPSPASLISPTYIQKVQVSTTRPSFTGYQPYSDTNIYRTFGGTAAYLKIDKTTHLTDIWMDETHKASNVGNALPSAGWTVPPTGIGGLKLMPNGWFAAFEGNTLYMSEPYRPHTWQHSMTFPTAIRGICPGAQGLVVTTFDETFLVSGSHPVSAMQMKLPIPVGGISQQGMVNIEGLVAFLSNDGIVLVQGTQASLGFSEKLFTREVWRARYGTILSGMRLSYHDGGLLASSPTADSVSGEYGFYVRIDEAAGMFTRFNTPISTTARLPVQDALYYSTTTDGVSGRNIYEFGAGAGEVIYTWTSKEYTFPSPVKMGAFFIRSSGSILVTVYCDGVLVHTQVVTTGYYRLPSSAVGTRWHFGLVSSNEVYEFIMAQSMGELRGA